MTQTWIETTAFCVISWFTDCDCVKRALAEYLFLVPGPSVSLESGGLRFWPRSRGVLPRSIVNAEPFQLLSTLFMNCDQGAVLLCQTPKLLLQMGDLHGNLLILHHFRQQLAPKWMNGKMLTASYWHPRINSVWGREITQERFPVHGKVRFLKFMQMSIFEYSASWLLGGEAKINTETMQTHRKDQEGKSLTDLKK